MKTIYICDICGKTFSQKQHAQSCEISHDTSENRRAAKQLKLVGLDPCENCGRAYFVYGCELNCSCWNQCKDYDLYIPTEYTMTMTITEE